MSSKKEQSSGISPYNLRYSEDFKRARVKSILSKEYTILQLSKHYGISQTSLYKWIYRYSDLKKGTRMVTEIESEGARSEKLRLRVAELERIVGQKQMALDIAEKTIAVASAELGYDVKKKFAVPLSNTSEVTTPNTVIQ